MAAVCSKSGPARCNRAEQARALHEDVLRLVRRSLDLGCQGSQHQYSEDLIFFCVSLSLSLSLSVYAYIHTGNPLVGANYSLFQALDPWDVEMSETTFVRPAARRSSVYTT